MKKKIAQIEFCIFDTETTGLQPETGDRIVELAAIRIQGKERLGVFHSLINPQRPIPVSATQIHGITPQMVEGAPPAKDVLTKFFEFAQGSYLCAYNAGFDVSFLVNENLLLGNRKPWEMPTIDVLKMARRLLPGLSSYRLEEMIRHLGINSLPLHRALADAEATTELFLRLCRKAQEYGVETAEELLAVAGLNSDLVENILQRRIYEIEEAIEKGVSLNIHYLSDKGGLTKHQIIPKQIQRQNDKNYLVAYCLPRQEERTFRIDGILRLESLQKKD